MADPNPNDIPLDTEEEDFSDIPESSLTEQQRAARLKKRRGLSINETIAADANLSVGSRGVDTSGVKAGSGAGAGGSSLTPGDTGSPAPDVAPGPRGSGMTPRGDTGSKKS